MKGILLAILVLAGTCMADYEIDVVPCDSIIEADTVPGTHMLADIHERIMENPSKWVCFYSPCDTKHRYGWAAVEKNKDGLFWWNRKDQETTTLYFDEYEGETFLAKVKFNKYGVKDVSAFTGKEAYDYMDLFVGVMMHPVLSCSDSTSKKARPK